MRRLSFVLKSLAAGVVIATSPFVDMGVRLAAGATTVAQTLVGSFDEVYAGPHRGKRANHAKGILCEGRFEPLPIASTLSRAAHFRVPVRVAVRFSNFGGDPDVSDAAAGASPHGCAVKFYLPDGTETDIVGHSTPYFPAATAEKFNEFLQALKGGAKTMKPFLKANPAAAQFVAAPKPAPVSFATVSYHYIDAFAFVDAHGTKRFVRYALQPTGATAWLGGREARSQRPDYLREELIARLARGPMAFDYIVQIADAGDPTHDPTSYWPASRRRVTLGRVTVTSIVKNNEEAQRTILFDPTRLPDGIELTDDPLPIARSQAYAISFARRTQPEARTS